MSDELALQLVAVLQEAVKILVPAIATAFAGYFAGRARHKTELAKLDLSHRFHARKHLFKYRLDAADNLMRNTRDITAALTKILHELPDLEKSNPNEAERHKLSLWTIVTPLREDLDEKVRELAERGLGTGKLLAAIGEQSKRLDSMSTRVVEMPTSELVSTILLASQYYAAANSLIIKHEAEELLKWETPDK